MCVCVCVCVACTAIRVVEGTFARLQPERGNKKMKMILGVKPFRFNRAFFFWSGSGLSVFVFLGIPIFGVIRCLL